MIMEFFIDFFASFFLVYAASIIAIYVILEYKDNPFTFIILILLGLLILNNTIPINPNSSWRFDARSIYILLVTVIYYRKKSFIILFSMIMFRLTMNNTGLETGIFAMILSYLVGVIINYKKYISPNKLSSRTVILKLYILIVTMNLSLVIFGVIVFGFQQTKYLLTITWPQLFIIMPILAEIILLSLYLYVKRRTLELEKIKGLEYSLHYDPLTKLKNKKYYYDYSRFQNRYQNTPIIILDINGLQRHNQNLGFNQGDKILTSISKVLLELFTEDEIFRFDSVDFLVDPYIAVNDNVYKVIRNKMKKHSILDEVTISFGMSSGDELDFHTAFTKASVELFEYKLTDKESSKNQILNILERILEHKEIEALSHTKRMCKVAKDFGEFLKLKPKEVCKLHLFAKVHDIGKVDIDESILNKKDKLSDTEWIKIKSHSNIGANILSSIINFEDLVYLVKTHHENYDGSGYPLGLKGSEIPYLSRIIRIIDSYDVMRNGRVYKQPMENKEIIKELKINIGIAYDPTLTHKFIEYLTTKSNTL